MDWVDEKAEKLFTYIRNLSFRKALLAYILVLAAVVWGMSYLTVHFCLQWEAGIWERLGETEIVKAMYYEKELLRGYRAGVLYSTDEAMVLFVDLFRVWCPFIYAFLGIILAVFLFYGRRLARPLSILEGSVEKIRGNDLNFHVVYESRDELGQLCDSVEEMRTELLRGKEEMWRLIERQKELNAAFAHDLRTPLTVLRGYTDFLARYIPEGKISREKLEATLGLMAEHLKRLEEYSRTMKGIRSIEEVPFVPEKTTFQSMDRKMEEVIFALNQVRDVEILYRNTPGMCGSGSTAEDESGLRGPGSAAEDESGLRSSESTAEDESGLRSSGSTAEDESGLRSSRSTAEDEFGLGDSSNPAAEGAIPDGIYVDDNLVMEVLENLLSNAIRYAGKRIEVLSDYDPRRQEWILAVRDDGPGFSEEQLERAMKPYYKEPEIGGPDEHFGIGLHICRELCRKHGGTLNAANSIQGGAIVTASFRVRESSRRQEFAAVQDY